MSFGTFFWGIITLISLFFIATWIGNKKREELTPDELAIQNEIKMANKSYSDAHKQIKKFGAINPAYVCPHCQTKGFVHTKPVVRKNGISGTKAAGAIFTGGVSILATGLSKKDNLTQAHCDNCDCTWDF